MCQILKINKTIEYFNLFHNSIDVSGARCIGEALKENNILTELDIGYNRIKNNGFKKVINGIIENKKSVLQILGVKYNFIKNKELEEELNILEKSDNKSLNEIRLKNNLLSSDFLSKLWKEQYTKMDKNIKMDIFAILYYIEPERLERTIWLNVDEFNENIKTEDNKFFNNYLGIPLTIKKIRGRKIGHKKDKFEKNAFIEFIFPISVKAAVNKDKSIYTLYFSSKIKNIYKAGVRCEYLFVKKKKRINHNKN